MESISYTYEVERIDTVNFHGWIVLECSEGMKEEIFSSSSYKDIKGFMHDLGAM